MPHIPSIFDDTELLSKLIDVIQPTIKKGQATPVPPTASAVDPNMIKTVAAKMVDRLIRDFSISVDKVGSPLFMKHLQNPEELFDFLAIGQVKYAGRPIVNLEYNQLTQDAQAQYTPYTWKEAGAHTAQTVGIYKDGLVEYLKSLQAQAGTDEAGKLLSTQITSLIDQINAVLKSDISHDVVKGKADESKTISEDAILDTIDTTLNVENPMSPPKGNVAVTPKNLKDKSSFYYWVQALKISKGGKVISHEEFSNDSFCDIIRVLYARAYYYTSNRGAPEDKAYLKLMTNLASQYGCGVEGSSGTGQGASGAGSAAGKGESQILDELGSLRPFNSQYISFANIQEFLKLYVGLTHNNPQVSSAANSISQSIAEVKRKMAVEVDVINMHQVIMGQFANLLSNRAEAARTINDLSDVISRAGTLYRQMLVFLQSKEDQFTDKGAFSAMEQQVAPGGPQPTNEDHLRAAYNQATQARQ